mmetsp:Transcript_21478/g.61555  ORF Transcript_21478/g.61555 Transcript_21478/m.61555 type:complete len:294 (+) Transcript_21478:30-911(+)
MNLSLLVSEMCLHKHSFWHGYLRRKLGVALSSLSLDPDSSKGRQRNYHDANENSNRKIAHPVPYHDLAIIHHEVVVDTPALPCRPIQVVGIRILLYDRITVVGSVNNIIAASKPIDRRYIWLRVVWYPTLFYSREEVPLQERPALHLKIPKDVTRAGANVCLFICDHLRFHKVPEELLPVASHLSVQHQSGAVGGNVIHNSSLELSWESINGGTPLADDSTYALGDNGVVGSILVATIKDVASVVLADILNVLPRRKGPTSFEEDVVGMGIQISIGMRFGIGPEAIIPCIGME